VVSIFLNISFAIWHFDASKHSITTRISEDLHRSLAARDISNRIRAAAFDDTISMLGLVHTNGRKWLKKKCKCCRRLVQTKLCRSLSVKFDEQPIMDEKSE